MSDGTFEDFSYSDLGTVINSRLSIFPEQCTSGIPSTQPIYLMETGSGDFLGVYDPDPSVVVDILNQNSQVKDLNLFILENANLSFQNSSITRRRRSLYNFVNRFSYEIDPTNRNVYVSSSSSVNSGISNPILCLENGAVVFFT